MTYNVFSGTLNPTQSVCSVSEIWRVTNRKSQIFLPHCIGASIGVTLVSRSLVLQTKAL